MVMPRCYEAGTTYLVTRRCRLRQHLLRPSENVNRIVAFCLAHAAARTGVIVHAATALSNHIHLVVTDPDARLGAFLHWLFTNIGRCLNAVHGERENVWAVGRPSVVWLVDDGGVEDAIAYTLGNAVASGLVERAAEWPGFRTTADQLRGHELRVERPVGFFRDDGPVPPAAVLRLRPPAAARPHEPDSLEGFVARVIHAVEACQRTAASKRGRTSRSVVGAAAVLAAPRHGSASSHEPLFTRCPHIAARCRKARLAAIEARRRFLDAYARALAAWRRGRRRVAFPSGTWWMRLAHRVVIAAPPGHWAGTRHLPWPARSG